MKCCALKAVSGLHFPDRPAPTDQFSSNLAKVVKDALKSDAVQFVEILDNAKTREILYSDTWGAGHELKRMSEDQAFTITTDAFFLRPQN